MLNPLPRQTWAQAPSVTDETAKRISSYAGRMVSRSPLGESDVTVPGSNSQSQSDLGLLTEAGQDARSDDGAGLVLPVTLQTSAQDRLVAIQEWEGYVTEIGEKTFLAELIDLTARRRNETELGEFLVKDLSESDQEELREGRLFRWVIGYQYKRGGTRQRVSEIYFRRVPHSSDRKLNAAIEKANSLADELGMP